MKILMLLSNPFMVDPRVHKEATALVEEGHEVSIIVWDRNNDYDDFEVVEGINVFRLRNGFFMKRLGNDFLRNPLWWAKSLLFGLGLFKSKFKFDVVHCHDLDTLAAGVFLKRLLGVKLVYDAHEIFGYMIFWDAPRFAVNLTFFMEKFLVSFADRIITVTEPVVKYFSSICKKKISLVMNCKDLVVDEYVKAKNEEFSLIYIGELHQRRFFPDLVDAIGSLDGVCLEIAAKRENLEMFSLVEKKSESYENVCFLGPIPFTEVIPKTLAADAVICMIDSSHPLTRVGLTTKLFDAMATGRPIIVSKGIYSADFVEENRCGVVADFSVEGLRNAVRLLADDPVLCEKLGRNGLLAAKKKYNWDVQKKALLKLYEELSV